MATSEPNLISEKDRIIEETKGILKNALRGAFYDLGQLSAAVDKYAGGKISETLDESIGRIAGEIAYHVGGSIFPTGIPPHSRVA